MSGSRARPPGRHRAARRRSRATTSLARHPDRARRHATTAPTACPCASSRRTASRSAATPGRALPQARRLGPRRHRDPARHDLGLLHAAGLDLGQAARAASSTTPTRQTLIEVFSGHGNSEEYRDFRAVRLRRGRAARAAPSRRADYLPDLLARRRDHPRALPGRRASDEAECDGARREARAERRRGRRPGPPDRAGRGARRVARRRSVSRLLPAGLQLPPGRRGPVHHGARATSTTPATPAALPLRLHRLERQPHRAPRHRLQGGRPARDDRGRRRRVGRRARRRSCAAPEASPEPQSAPFDASNPPAVAFQALRDRAPGVASS